MDKTYISTRDHGKVHVTIKASEAALNDPVFDIERYVKENIQMVAER